MEKANRRQKSESGQLLNTHITPPVTVNSRGFLGTGDGQVVCLSAENGETPVDGGDRRAHYVPAGRRQGTGLVSAGSGSLYCLETGDGKDDGRLM